ncbi:ethanolamine kinase [Plectosphaerella plurivora]|uniref:ethanolamine kinase n=1 Tax=Plectosphaerella plurivora TaxID=936078 RepID=A0A9P9A9K1_9PEZI|nr:ethanolamine kinase [Plectosphaerella plurivora]
MAFTADVQAGQNGSQSSVRFVASSYDSQQSQETATQLILAVRPEWASEDSNIEFVRFTDGITNTLLKAVNKKKGWTKEQVDAEAILLRAYGPGTAVLIDREREAQNHELLMKHDLAPELVARFNNGMLYRYIKGTVTTPEDLRKPSIYNAVAERLAEWHAIVPCIASKPSSANGQHTIDDVAPGKPPPNVWTVMQKWILALPHGTAEEKARQASLQEELGSLVKQLSQRPGLGANGLVFAHCDLLSGNVIVMPPGQAGEPKGATSVHFIDFEYATPSPAAFDLANHFAEWGGFDCDFSVLPTRAQRREFVQHYIARYFELLQDQDGVDLDVEAAKLNEEIDVFRGVPGFYWGIWALIQAQISDKDFDYASYAEVRLNEYWAWRAEEDGSRAASGKEKPLREARWAQEE